MKIARLAATAALALAALALTPASRAEDPPVTTADKVEWIENPKLPAIKDRVENAEFKYENKTIPFPINVWGGWAPVVAANGGFEPNDFGIFAQKHGFKLDVQVIEDPADALTAFANGKTPILWGTVDMMALFSSELIAGPRPKVFLQIDWSNGGDGIVVRSSKIASANDLKGKTVVLCPFSPSHAYLLTILRAAGIDPKEVKLRYTKTAYQAAKAFLDDKTIDAVVTFSPDIYKLPEKFPAEMKLLTSTGDAKRLIADVFAVREDFAKAHPEVVKGLVAGILEGIEFTKKSPDEAAKLLFEGYKKFGLASVADVKAMMGDAHLTNHAENLTFFADPRNPTSFARTYDDAVDLYKKLGVLERALPAATVADPAPLQDPELKRLYAGQKDEYSTAAPTLSAEKRAKLAERRTKGSVVTMVVYFGAAQEHFDEKSEEVQAALLECAKLAGKFSGGAVLIEGFTDPVSGGLTALEKRKDDNPMVPRVIAAKQRRLEAFSRTRASFVAKALEASYGLNPQAFETLGRGGARPITDVEAERWKNRRVEITILPVEAE